MGQIFSLDPSVKSVIQQALDDLITELGKECLIVYPPVWTPCSNCVWNSVDQRSANYWRNGGPMPFPDGTACPVCGGRGQKAVETSRTYKLLCSWEPKKFDVPIQNLPVTTPYSFLQTKGYLSDLPDILKADHLIFETAISGIAQMKYRPWGEAGDRSNIIQGRYFVATWERVPV